nr:MULTISPECIES: AraC family transcriptional regulator [unclassified Rhodococcus (in: high G+C Gram-positive bacteria)]
MESTVDDRSSRMWRGDDALGDALHSLRMRGVFYVRSELTAPWGLDIPAMEDCLWFHAPVVGSCLLELPGTKPRLVGEGECVLVPHGRGHRVVDDPSSPSVSMYDPEPEWISDRFIVLEHGGGGERAVLICGAVKFDHPTARSLLDVLPDVLVGDRGSAVSAAVLELLANEAAARRPGGEAVVTRLADILIIDLVRAWLREEGAEIGGWLGALRDRQIGAAVIAMHRYPERPWTVADLARTAAMSRSAFAARFTALVGEAPVVHLTRRRMQLAAAELARSNATISSVAASFGYGSDAAFSRAFTRTMGRSPSSMRHSGSAS